MAALAGRPVLRDAVGSSRLEGSSFRARGGVKSRPMLQATVAMAKVGVPEKTGCVIVGGGPAGLTAALLLANRGWTGITVLERSKQPTPYNPDLGFVYAIDYRGVQVLDTVGLKSRLLDISAAGKDYTIERVEPDGKRTTLKFPVADTHWLPRHVFTGMLYGCISDSWTSQVKVVLGVSSLELAKDEAGVVTVTATTAATGPMRFKPRLIIGADGISSVVRASLRSWEEPPPMDGTARFDMQLLPSPAAGLRYKVLTLPAGFALNKEGTVHAVAQTGYFFTGVIKGRLKQFRLGILPVRDTAAPRTANVITLPTHELWQAKTAEQLYALFETNFPQINVRSLIAPAEAARFAASDGGRFPTPQFCRGCYWLSPAATQAVALVGDALHAFPPDLGQGVNSAMGDVEALAQALVDSGDDLATALPLYEERRAPEAEALVQLVQTTYPWQYTQDVVMKNVWMAVVAFRAAAAAILPSVFKPHVFFRIMRPPATSYVELLRSEREAVRRAVAAAVAAAFMLAGGLVFAAFRVGWLKLPA